MNQKMIDEIVWWIPTRKLRDNIRHLLCEMSNVFEHLSNKKDIYGEDFGDYHISDRWLERFDDDDFAIKLNNLLKNLDDESIYILRKIINRMQKYFKHNDRNCLKMDEQELKLYKEMEYKLCSVIEMKDCENYNDFYIPLNMLRNPNYILYPIHTIIGYELFFEKNMKDVHFGKADIIDAGACIGDSSLVFSKITDGNVYAFEPVSEIYKELENTISINKSIKNIVPINKALSDFTGGSEIGIYQTSLEGCSLMKGHEHKSETVQVISLDEFVLSNNIKNVGLIKADVEGAEMSLLKGAINTIIKNRPYLIISIYHRFEDFFDIKPYIESLNLNYKLYIKRFDVDSPIKETILFCIPN